EQVAIRRIDRDVFPNPIVEVRRTDRKRIAVHQRRHAHGGLAAIGEAVEADSLRIHERQLRKPVQNAVVLSEDDGEQRFLQWIGFALEQAKSVATTIRIVRRKTYDAR